jgi:hypothetical protein
MSPVAIILGLILLMVAGCFAVLVAINAKDRCAYHRHNGDEPAP